jgi:hypothetical protein
MHTIILVLHYWMTATPHYWQWVAGYVAHYHRLPGIDLLLGA